MLARENGGTLHELAVNPTHLSQTSVKPLELKLSVFVGGEKMQNAKKLCRRPNT